MNNSNNPLIKREGILAVIVSYNGEDKILKNIKSIKKNVGLVLIVDNGSNQNTLKFLDLLKVDENIIIKRLSENMGLAYALNLGIKYAREENFEWLLTLDQDSFLDDNFFEHIDKAYFRKSEGVCFTPEIVQSGSGIRIKGVNKGNTNGQINYAITSGTLVKVEIFKKIGLYNEGLFLDGVDLDFSLRLRSYGYGINLVHNAILEHNLGEKSNAPKIINWFYISHSPIRRYYMYRNIGYLLKLHFKNFPLIMIKSVFSHLLLLLFIPFYDKDPFKGVVYSIKGIKDCFRGIQGKHLDI